GEEGASRGGVKGSCARGAGGPATPTSPMTRPTSTPTTGTTLTRPTSPIGRPPTTRPASPSRSAPTPRPTSDRICRTSPPSSSSTRRDRTGSPTGARVPSRITPPIPAPTHSPRRQPLPRDPASVPAGLLPFSAERAVQVDVPPVDDPEVREGIDELVKLYVAKGGFRLGDKNAAVPLSEVDGYVAKLSRDEKLMFLGEKTISRLGCFGCHNIAGFENAKPIGTPLNGWGIKSPAKLDYAHILEYLDAQPVGDQGNRDGTDRYYQEQLGEQTRAGFLYQKLHRPRSYDFKKTNEDLRSWDERLRMPQFAWANDPKAIEE